MSAPLDLGWWRAPNGQRKLLTWWSDTGAVVLVVDDGQDVGVAEDDLRRRLEDWPSHCDLPSGLGWVAQQLEGCR